MKIKNNHQKKFFRKNSFHIEKGRFINWVNNFRTMLYFCQKSSISMLVFCACTRSKHGIYCDKILLYVTVFHTHLINYQASKIRFSQMHPKNMFISKKMPLQVNISYNILCIKFTETPIVQLKLFWILFIWLSYTS